MNGRVTIIDSLKKLEEFRPQWQEFCGTHAEEFGFQQDPLVVSALLSADPGKTPCIAVVASGDGIQCVAPCFSAERSFVLKLGLWSMRRTRVRVMRILGDGFIYAKGVDKRALACEALEALSAPEIGWDFILLENLPVPGSLWDIFETPGTVPQRLRLVPFPGRMQKVRRLDMPSSFDEYLKSLTSDTRYNLLRRRKKLEESADGQLALARVTRPDQVAMFLEHADRVGARSWQAATFGNVARNAEGERLYTERLAQAGFLRSYLLQHRGEPVAFVRGYQHKGVYYHDETAYDRAWAKWGPGTVLNLMLIEDLFGEDRPSVLDFGFGDNEYKRIFSNRVGDACVAFIVDTERRRGGNVVKSQRALGYVEQAGRAVLKAARIDRAVSRRLKHRRGRDRGMNEQPNRSPGLFGLISSDIRAKAQWVYGEASRRTIMKALATDGTFAMIMYRLMQWCHRRRLIPMALICSKLNGFFGRCIIGRGAQFGPGFVLIHSYGVVINTAVHGGRDVKLEHAVTIGAEKDRAPALGDNIFVGAGAKILGGVRIGNNVKIGANAVVVNDVPDDATAVGVPARVVGEGKKEEETNRESRE